MADLEVADDRYANVDIESILARVDSCRRPLTFTRKRSLCQAPEFMKRLTGVDELQEGDSFRLECRAVGFPKPEIRWYKDDEEITNNERYTFEVLDEGYYAISLNLVSKCDEAAYKCKAENKEGTSSSILFVHVKGKKSANKKSQKRSKSQSPSRRTVSFPPLVPTIVERVVEEEKAAAERETLPPSPLTSLYDGVTMKQRNIRPQFLGDWAFAKEAIGPNHSGEGSDTDEDDDMVFLATNREGDLHDSSSDDAAESKSETESDTGSPDKKKPEEANIPSAVNADKKKYSTRNREQNETIKSEIKSRNTVIKSVNINRNSTVERTFGKKYATTDTLNVQRTFDEATLTPGPLIINKEAIGPTCTATPIAGALPKRSKPRKLIVRKRSSSSSKNMFSVSDFAMLFLLVTCVTFISLCVDLAPQRFLSMVFSGFIIYSFVMALLTSDCSWDRTTNNVNSSPT